MILYALGQGKQPTNVNINNKKLISYGFNFWLLDMSHINNFYLLPHPQNPQCKYFPLYNPSLLSSPISTFKIDQKLPLPFLVHIWYPCLTPPSLCLSSIRPWPPPPPQPELEGFYILLGFIIYITTAYLLLLLETPPILYHKLGN